MQSKNSQIIHKNWFLISGLLIWGIIPLSSEAQVFISKTTDGRFIGKNIFDYRTNDSKGLMESFVIGFEWWTLMGEPLEIYEFKWNSSKYFKIDGETLHRNSLNKYPDLLKRFDALKPTKVDVVIHCWDVGVGEFNRKVKSHKLIIEPPGKIGKDLVPGSPSWSDFIEPLASVVMTTDERATAAKQLFTNAKSLRPDAYLSEVTWPEGEMKAILAKYKEYEKKEKEKDKEEKPKKEDDFWSGNSTTDDKTTANNADDFWSGNRGKNNTPGTITDIDGNVYKTIIIGTQVWMAENLKTTRLNDGTRIPNVIGNSEWIAIKTPAFCWYLNERITYGNTYGALYNGYTVKTDKLCPIGWHVPSDSEWGQLTDYLGGIDVAGGKLKEAGTTHWKSPNTGATNETGFTALPSGYRSYYDGNFDGNGFVGDWWISNKYRGIYWRIGNAGIGLDRNDHSFINGRSVRCVKD